MPYGLLFGEDFAVADWCYKKFSVVPIPTFKAIGIVDIEKQELVGAALFQNYTTVNVDLSYYGPHTLSLGIVRSLASVALSLGVARGTVLTSKRNRRFINGLLKLGFKVEGAQRCFYGHEDTNRNTAIRLVIFTDGLKKLSGNDGPTTPRSAQPKTISPFGAPAQETSAPQRPSETEAPSSRSAARQATTTSG